MVGFGYLNLRVLLILVEILGSYPGIMRRSLS